MAQLCCPPCRLRFKGSAAASLTACPHCGEPPTVVRAAEAMGFQLSMRDHHLSDALLLAVAAAKRDPLDTSS